MSVTFVQGDDTSGICAAAAYCSGRSLGGGTNAAIKAIVAGATGFGPDAISIPASQTNRVVAIFDCVVGSSINVGGTCTLNWTVAGVGANAPSLNEVHVCDLDNACANQGSLGSLTGLSELLTVGVKQHIVTIANGSFVSGDHIAVLLVMTNGSSMSAATADITPDLTIVFGNAVVTAHLRQLTVLGVG